MSEQSKPRQPRKSPSYPKASKKVINKLRDIIAHTGSLKGASALVGVHASTLGDMLRGQPSYQSTIDKVVAAHAKLLLKDGDDSSQMTGLVPPESAPVKNYDPLQDVRELRQNLQLINNVLEEEVATLMNMVENGKPLIRSALGPVGEEIVAALRRLQAATDKLEV